MGAGAVADFEPENNQLAAAVAAAVEHVNERVVHVHEQGHVAAVAGGRRAGS